MRLVLCLLVSVTLLAPTAFAQSSITQVMAERLGDDRILLTWVGDDPVDVYVSSDPHAELDAMDQLAEGLTGGQYEAAVPKGVWRPYFVIRSRKGEAVRMAERLLPLEGGRNFRDLGGYATADGRRTRWGLAFRSGVLSGLTSDDYANLGDLGIAVVCDFRSSEERANEATVWRGASAPRIVAWGYSDEGSEEEEGMADLFGNATTAEVMRQVMLSFYDQIAYEHADKYAVMFRQLAAGETPCCSIALQVRTAQVRGPLCS